MPYYVFVNPETQELRDVFFKMNDVKEYFGLDGEDKIEWRRVYSAPQMTIDTKINPFSGKDFVKKTQGAKTYGELVDLSKEMSQQRESKIGGADPQTEKAKENFYKPKKQS